MVGPSSLAPHDERARANADLRVTPKFLHLLPLIAQRPALVRWNRDAESIYKPEETIRNRAIDRIYPIYKV